MNACLRLHTHTRSNWCILGGRRDAKASRWQWRDIDQGPEDVSIHFLTATRNQGSQLNNKMTLGWFFQNRRILGFHHGSLVSSSTSSSNISAFIGGKNSEEEERGNEGQPSPGVPRWPKIRASNTVNSVNTRIIKPGKERKGEREKWIDTIKLRTF